MPNLRYTLLRVVADCTIVLQDSSMCCYSKVACPSYRDDNREICQKNSGPCSTSVTQSEGKREEMIYYFGTPKAIRDDLLPADEPAASVVPTNSFGHAGASALAMGYSRGIIPPAGP